jgi:hypothetical protein
LKALQSFLQLLTLLFTFARDEKLRREGERRVRMEELESAYERQGEAHEIDLKVVRGDLSPADIERLRKYERDHP